MTTHHISRRSLLAGAMAGSLATMGLPLGALAGAVTPRAGRKLIFVFNPGGWDPTRVFAPQFGQAGVDMEPGAAPWTVGGLSLVDHPSRPAVRAFFEAYASQSLLLNGVMVRSIAHEICTMLALTGSTSGLLPDWPTRVAHAARDQHTLPHLVVGGPSFPGDLGVSVAKAGTAGQLESLVSGQVHGLSDLPVQGPDRVAENVVDRYLQRRAAARAMGARSSVEARLTADVEASMEKLMGLKDLRYTMDFSADLPTLDRQAQIAVDALRLGVSRCVSLSHGLGAGGQGWDTHADNDAGQAPLFDGLFAGLSALMAALRSAPASDGTLGRTLADETLVVVLSEMGRTPKLNNLLGKDHWPYTSMLLVGPGVTGGRVVGGYDALYYGLPVDPGSAESVQDGPLLTAEVVGATLMAYADVDPASALPGVQPLTGVLL